MMILLAGLGGTGDAFQLCGYAICGYIYSAGSAVDIYSALHLKCNFTVGLFPPRFSFLT